MDCALAADDAAAVSLALQALLRVVGLGLATLEPWFSVRMKRASCRVCLAFAIRDDMEDSSDAEPDGEKPRTRKKGIIRIITEKGLYIVSCVHSPAPTKQEHSPPSHDALLLQI